MNRLTTFSLFFFYIPFFLFADGPVRTADIRAIALGGSGCLYSDNMNPALTADCRAKTISLQYYNQYGIRELGQVAVSFCWPWPTLNVGVQVSSFGWDAYRESRFAVLFGKQLGKRWSIGIAVSYEMLQTKVLEYTPAMLSSDIGVVYEPLEKVKVAFSLLDFPAVRLSASQESDLALPDYALRTGFSWQFLPEFLLTGEVVNDKQKVWAGNIGAEYRLFDACLIRAGIACKPFAPAMGIGYAFSRFTVDAAFVWHRVLGISSGISLKVEL